MHSGSCITECSVMTCRCHVSCCSVILTPRLTMFCRCSERRFVKTHPRPDARGRQALGGTHHDTIAAQQRAVHVEAVQQRRCDTRQVSSQRLLAGRRVGQPDECDEGQQVRRGLRRLSAGHPAHHREAPGDSTPAGRLQRATLPCLHFINTPAAQGWQASQGCARAVWARKTFLLVREPLQRA